MEKVCYYCRFHVVERNSQHKYKRCWCAKHDNGIVWAKAGKGKKKEVGNVVNGFPSCTLSVFHFEGCQDWEQVQ